MRDLDGNEDGITWVSLCASDRRDKFAAAALQALIALDFIRANSSAESIAEQAVEYADALLAALNS